MLYVGWPPHRRVYRFGRKKRPRIARRAIVATVRAGIVQVWPTFAAPGRMEAARHGGQGRTRTV